VPARHGHRTPYTLSCPHRQPSSPVRVTERQPGTGTGTDTRAGLAAQLGQEDHRTLYIRTGYHHRSHQDGYQDLARSPSHPVPHHAGYHHCAARAYRDDAARSPA